MLNKKGLFYCSVLALLSSGSFAGYDVSLRHTCESEGFIKHVHQHCMTQCSGYDEEGYKRCYRSCRHTEYVTNACPDYDVYPSQRYSRPSP